MMKYHEAASIFPLDEEHIDELAANIKERGLEVRIEVLDGKIIDGRRRWLACKKAKVKPDIVEAETDDPIAYVMSLNYHRRNLTSPQMGIVAGKADKLRKKMEKDAENRRKRKPADFVRAPGPTQTRRSRDDLGKAFGVSGRTAERGKIVVEKGIPELADAVMKDGFSLQRAEEIAKMPERKQLTALQQAKLVQKTATKGFGPSHEEMEHAASNAMNFARIAITQLERISAKDPNREKAFAKVEKWIQSQRKKV